MKGNLLFDMLSPAARREVIDSMTTLSVHSGTRIITQVCHKRLDVCVMQYALATCIMPAAVLTSFPRLSMPSAAG